MLRQFVVAASALLFVACSGGEKSVEPPVATSIAASSSTALTGVAGGATSTAPSVIVKDQRDDPMPGIAVTFAVTNGGGSVSSASATTDASGVATVTWTLGTVAGQNQLTATAGTLGTITFTATGEAGAAASMTKTAGDNQAGVAGTPVPVPPAVTVKDANGNPKAGVVVTFTVGAGGGTVTGATATTNASGVAAAGSWTLGPTPGVNTLTASSPGLPTVTFTAASASAACAARTAHTIGTTTNGTLAGGDCQLSDGTYLDFFTTTISEAGAYRFQQTAGFNSYLFLATADGSVIAENDDASEGTSNSSIKALLPSGSYLLAANSLPPVQTGDYSISSSAVSTAVTGCEQVYVVRNISTTQNIETGDCLASASGAPPIYADVYDILLRSGQSITVTMASSAIDSYIDIYRITDSGSLVLVASNDNKDASSKDAVVAYTAATSTYYLIAARTAVSAQTGSYTMTIQ